MKNIRFFKYFFWLLRSCETDCKFFGWVDVNWTLRKAYMYWRGRRRLEKGTKCIRSTRVSIWKKRLFWSARCHILLYSLENEDMIFIWRENLYRCCESPTWWVDRRKHHCFVHNLQTWYLCSIEREWHHAAVHLSERRK